MRAISALRPVAACAITAEWWPKNKGVCGCERSSAFSQLKLVGGSCLVTCPAIGALARANATTIGIIPVYIGVAACDSLFVWPTPPLSLTTFVASIPHLANVRRILIPA